MTLHEAVAEWLAYARGLGVATLPMPASLARRLAPARRGATAAPGASGPVRAASAPARLAPAAAPTASAASAAPAQAGTAASGSQAPSAPRPSLEAVRAELGDCQRCRLATTRRNIVFGVGNPAAELVFVGEAPGYDEDVQGEPFVGAAGQLLTKMIEAMGLERKDVYIANILKCRPPENRNPQDDEIEACSPFLAAQLDALRPRVIVALGKFSAQTLLDSEIPITRLRGQLSSYRGVPLMPTYHPAFLLRSPERKKEAWQDLKAVMALLKSATGAAGSGAGP